MDKQRLIARLEELDEHLSSTVDALLIGGAAMILHFGANRATRDIDVVVLRGNTQELRQAVRKIAHKYDDLPEDWMNDAVKGFVDILPPDFYHRLVPLEFPFQHLRLYVPGRPEQAAMKIVALREQDLHDLELLLPKMSNDERDVLVAIMHHVSQFRIDWAQKIRYFLQERGWEID
jgi:alkanesulfonate monooxygenase SsuD/methylene tetrahydromethanopterin reductase-like flavin-dependent oxidoreductase (luciferase family)